MSKIMKKPLMQDGTIVFTPPRYALFVGPMVLPYVNFEVALEEHDDYLGMGIKYITMKLEIHAGNNERALLETLKMQKSTVVRTHDTGIENDLFTCVDMYLAKIHDTTYSNEKQIIVCEYTGGVYTRHKSLMTEEEKWVIENEEELL